MIKNKKILSDLLEKEKVYRENEGEGDGDSNRSYNSDGTLRAETPSIFLSRKIEGDSVRRVPKLRGHI